MSDWDREGAGLELPRAVELNPTSIGARRGKDRAGGDFGMLAHAYAGRQEDARRLLNQIMDYSRTRYVAGTSVAAVPLSRACRHPRPRLGVGCPIRFRSVCIGVHRRRNQT